MKKSHFHLKTWLTVSALTGFLCLGTPVIAQSASAQNSPALQGDDATRQEFANFDRFLDSHPETAEQVRKDPSFVNNEDFLQHHPALQTYLQDHPALRQQIKDDPNSFMRMEARYDRREDDRDRGNREELAHFDQFLDTHRETAEQLRKNPSLVDNQEFVGNHPALQSYMREHPELREQLKQNPNAFMHQEERYDRREDDRDRGVSRDEVAHRDDDRDRGTNRDEAARRDNDRDRGTNRDEVARFDQFLDSHRETADQLRKDPSLVDNQEYVRNHPDLQAYLQDHPGVRDQIRQDPNAFMHQEARYDRRDDDRDRANREELAHFDHFLDTHRETAEQLRKDPSLVDNQDFLQHHPALQTYLQDHTELREQIKSNPNAFMQQEARYDNREGGMDRDATGHRQAASFGEFLGGHSEISQRLSEDPSLVKNQEYMENHPELKQYLSAHPEVKEELTANPRSFVRAAQRFSTTSNTTTTAPAVKTPMPADPAKPKQ
jgi:hypothetical protein